jgi:hypothetical protein
MGFKREESKRDSDVDDAKGGKRKLPLEVAL